jgi:peptidyl-prolyl cis-trans isomerase C
MIIGSLTLLWSFCAKKDPIVAKIGNEQVVTQSEFRAQMLKMRSLNLAEKATLSELKETLDTQINQKLRVLAAFEMKIDQDSAIVSEFEQEKKRILLQRLYDKEILEKAVKESEIREFYSKTNKEVSYSDIYFEVSQTAPQTTVDSIRAIAEKVVKQIRDGADFESMARQYSNTRGQSKDGLNGTMKWTRNDDPIQKIIFSLNAGQISDPIRNKMGFHVLKVDEINTVPQKPYNQAREEIFQALLKDRREKISQEAQRYWEDLKSKENVQWKDAAIDSLARRIGNWTGQSALIVLDSLDAADPGFKSMPLVVYNDGKIDVAVFVRNARQGMLNPRTPLDRVPVLKNIIERQIMGEVLANVALKKKLDRDSDYKRQAQSALENSLSRAVYEREINSKSKPDEAQIRAYYDQNRDSLYVTGEKVKIQEILVKSPDLARQIIQWVKQGKDFGALAAQYTIRPGFKEKKGDFGYMQKRELGVISQHLDGLHKGDIAGPIEQPNEIGYSIVKLLDITQNQAQVFEYIKTNVRRDLTLKLIKQTESQWLAKIKEKYPVTVDEKTLQATFKPKG